MPNVPVNIKMPEDTARRFRALAATFVGPRQSWMVYTAALEAFLSMDPKKQQAAIVDQFAAQMRNVAKSHKPRSP